MRTLSAALFLFFLFLGEAKAQFVQIGNGNFLGTAGGPLVARNNTANYQTKFAYIFPSASLGNMRNGDTITSLSFYRSAGDPFNGKCSLQIWLDNTLNDDWGMTPISFNNHTIAAQEVYHDHPQNHINNNDSFYEIPLNKPYVFDSTKGNNLSMFVFYEQFDTIKGSVRFYFEGSSTIPSYYSPQVRYSIGTTADDSLRIVTEYHPTIRFSFPREDQDVGVIKLYTLGKLPVPLGNPDSVKVLLRNVGKKDIQNLKMYTYSQGSNRQKDSFNISIVKGEESFFNVPSLEPNKLGTDTIFIQSTDNNNSNNFASSLRWANENIYSYRDISLSPAPGGIGFNGSQGDFVARFLSNKPKNLNQISVAFSGTGRLFKLGIWDFDSTRNQPGKLIWQSDSLTTRGGTYIYNLPKAVKVNGSFFVGVRQLDLNNVAFGYQMEQPVRPKTFYYAVPLGDTNWVDFHPDAPYKFIIEPRLQADYDVAANSIILPKDTFNVFLNDTVAPAAQISNIGVENITDSVLVRCIIRSSSSVVYDETIYDSIASGVVKTLTFPKTFVPKQFGNHTVTLFVSHIKDQVVDNDTITKNIVVGCDRDVMIRNAFPSGTGTFIARVDTLLPITTIMNLAYRNSGLFDVVSEIWVGDSLKTKETQSLQLTPLGTQILVWKQYPTNDTGKLRWIVYTALKNDEYTLNDTSIFTGIIYKTIDVASQVILQPDTHSNYNVNQRIDIKSRVYNQGVLKADSVKVIFEIFKPNGILDFSDSLIQNVNPRNVQTYSFLNAYFPQEKGIYKTKMYIADSNDLYRENDTISSFFTVGRPADYLVDSINLPSTMSTSFLGINWSVSIGNAGFDSSLKEATITANIVRNNLNWLNETQSVKVKPNGKINFQFTKKFKPLFTGLYYVEVVVSHPQDINKLNDTIRTVVEVKIGKDVLIESISKPFPNEVFYLKDKVDSSEVRVLNQGNDSLKKVVLRSQWIFEKAIYYQKSDTLDFYPGELKSINYPVNIQFNSAGKGYHRAWVVANGDEDPNNDTLLHAFEVRSKRDLWIKYVDSPSTTMPVYTEYKLFPRLTLVNQASDSSTFPGEIVVKIKRNGIDWYNERIPYPSILPFDSSFVQATQAAYFTNEGSYEFWCYAENNVDENTQNDTFAFGFQVIKNAVNQYHPKISVYPNPTSNTFVVLSGIKNIQEIKLKDILGREIPVKWFENAVETKVVWDENLASGAYFLWINQLQGNTSVRIIAE